MNFENCQRAKATLLIFNKMLVTLKPYSSMSETCHNEKMKFTEHVQHFPNFTIHSQPLYPMKPTVMKHDQNYFRNINRISSYIV